MLVIVLATLMFFAMLAATYDALRKEMSEVRVVVDEPRIDDRSQCPTFGTRPW